MKEVELIYIKHIMKAADELNIRDKINTLDKQLSPYTSKSAPLPILMAKTVIKDISAFWNSFSWIETNHKLKYEVTYSEAHISTESWRQQIDEIRNTIYTYERVLPQSIYRDSFEWIDDLLNKWYRIALDLNAPTTWEVGYVYEVEAESYETAKEITDRWFYNGAKPLRSFANKITG